jgi:hypothetical protein
MFRTMKAMGSTMNITLHAAHPVAAATGCSST